MLVKRHDHVSNLAKIYLCIAIIITIFFKDAGNNDFNFTTFKQFKRSLVVVRAAFRFDFWLDIESASTGFAFRSNF